MTDDDEPLSDVARRLGGDEDGDDAAAADGIGEDGPTDATDGIGEDGPADAADATDDAPLSDLVRRIERRRSERRDAGRTDGRDGRVDGAAAADDAESLFESMAVETVDSEAMWAGLVEEDDGATGVGPAGDAAEPVDDELPGHDDHVVPKSEFCQQCPHLAAPPELACTHEGTEIVEVVETDRFRVRNCPMVDED
ncbi:hypothetical protein SAMN04487947_2519 [Halogeometricum rufum]|uniref:DUF8135 domain-containing protein n=1 Tax=Halogeometricum rufum TaxID=553469 RepID=A0A1I6HUF3_9EURY|nr:hypothetical protein [Halogeometricum rufum]SFR58085.1 hypothetical protein SAMN04487947_2519 [Halogeometricum rufum]